jgi:hypothetical protein
MHCTEGPPTSGVIEPIGTARPSDRRQITVLNICSSVAVIRASSPDDARPQRGTGWTKHLAVQSSAASFHSLWSLERCGHYNNSCPLYGSRCCGPRLLRMRRQHLISRVYTTHTQPRFNVNEIFYHSPWHRQASTCIRKSRCAGTGCSRFTRARISSYTPPTRVGQTLFVVLDPQAAQG